MGRAGACGPALLGGALLLVACPVSDPSPRSVDAGPRAPALESTRHGFRLPLVEGWKAVPPEALGSLVPVAEARRVVETADIGVVPKIRVTLEESVASSAEDAYQAVKAELESKDAMTGIDVIRTSLGLRPVGSETVGDVSFEFRVGGPNGRVVHQRTLLVWRRTDPATVAGPQPPTANLLSISATYLARESSRVGPEIQQMFSRLELIAGASKGTSR